MNRSKNFVFVSFCLLAQGIRASGIVKKFPGAVQPIINLLNRYNINIVQMACPELHFDTFQRRPCGKKKYDNPKNRSICRKLAEKEVDFIHLLQKNGCTVDVILGVEFSPSCAVSLLTAPPPKRYVKGEGIYIEELKKVLHSRRISLPIIGVQIYQMGNTLDELNNLLEKR